MRAITLLAAASAVAASAVMVTSPLNSQQRIQSISARDKQDGAKAHPELLEQFGGAYGGPQAVYVTRVGQRIATQSGLSNSQRDFTITLLNSPVNNAFAIPGGYVYMTRQLMALTNDEAELASVLGHEVGHVAARHGQRRQTAATRNTILGAIGQVITGAVLGSSGFGNILQRGIGTASQLATLRFSRDQEFEADDLGIGYLARAGYDPTASSTLLASLAAQSALDARVRGGDARSLPSWASTHPDPASRVRRALTKAQATRVNQGLRSRDAFLSAVDGVLYEDDPRQGVVEGRSFRHPDLRLTFTVPQGFTMSNGARAVSITGQSGQAQFGGGRSSASLDSYIGQVFRSVAGTGAINYGEVRGTRVNGLDAAYSTARANTQSGQVDVTVFAYRFDATNTYHFVTLTRVGAAGVFEPMFESLRRLTSAEASAIRARRVQVVAVQRGQTAATLAGRMAYDDYKLERFLVLNGLQQGQALTPGQRVKIVTY